MHANEPLRLRNEQQLICHQCGLILFHPKQGEMINLSQALQIADTYLWNLCFFLFLNKTGTLIAIPPTGSELVVNYELR